MKLIILLQFLLVSYAYSTVCPCGAPPECGSSRPPNCRDKGVDTPLDPFFANMSVQKRAPKAFALSDESREFILITKKQILIDGSQFLSHLNRDKALQSKVQRYDSFSLEDQIKVLREVFSLQVKSLGIKAPKLVIDTNYSRAAFFKFNIEDDSNGTVYINPKKTYEENRMTSLSLLLHETKHAAQLSLAKNKSTSIQGAHFRAAFVAQKKLLNSLNFSDFLTLNNEYEAFSYANYIIYKLYNGKFDMIDMGTFASQFDQAGHLKIDLERLHYTPSNNIYEDFNTLMKEQKSLLGL